MPGLVDPPSDPNVFGKRVTILGRRPPAYHSWEFLHHYEGTIPSPDGVGVQSLNSSKFHRGFQRRRADEIFAADEFRQAAAAWEKEKALIKQAAVAARKSRLTQLNNQTGFDIITGAVKDGKLSNHEERRGADLREIQAAERRQEAKARCSEKDSGARDSEMDKVAQILLRDSHYRFFAPQTTGKKLIRRQEYTHYRQGASASRTSSLLGYGRADLPSFGVDDQFQHADYGVGNYRSSLGTSALAKKEHDEKLAEINAVRNLR